MPDFNISDSMAESIFNNEIIQNMTDEAFDNILDTIDYCTRYYKRHTNICTQLFHIFVSK